MTNRIFDQDELVLASHNDGKLVEIAALFDSRPFKISSAMEYDLPEPEETEATFTGNALLKAKATTLATGKVALADDSGLVVPAINGDPGIYSARWAGPNKDFGMAMERVNSSIANLKNTRTTNVPEGSGDKDRSAHFICVLAMCWPDGHEEVFEGRVDGTLVWPPRGKNGFGYDPMFVATGYDVTFGEMDSEEKLAIGHRADAFSKLVAAILP